MNIEEFYDQNEARRDSAEIEFGSEWTDSVGNDYELSWVEATGELYLMLGPAGTMHADLFFGSPTSYTEPIESLIVEVIGMVASQAEVEEKLAGWENAMIQPHSLQWIAERFGATK